MKTKEVIRQLMEADPSGEEEVCVGNVDIHFIERLPAYYDGSLQVLERDPTTKYYNIVGGKYKRSGNKISIRTLSISDAISNAHGEDEFVVDYSELAKDTAEATKKSHNDLRAWHKRLDNELELENFLQWAKSKVEVADAEDANGIFRNFFDKFVTPDDPLPEGGIPLGQSYVSTRHKQWDERFEVLVYDGFLKIRNRNDASV